AWPDLQVSNVNVANVVANHNGSFSLTVTWTVTNVGNTTALNDWMDQAYLSTTGALDSSSQNLSGYFGRPTSLAPGASYNGNFTFTSSTATQPGNNYTLFIKADGRGAANCCGYGNASINGSNVDNGNLVEAGETNNVQGVPVTLAWPDLQVS